MKKNKHSLDNSTNVQFNDNASQELNDVDTSYGSKPTENVASMNNNGIPTPMQIENLTLPIQRFIELYNYNSKK